MNEISKLREEVILKETINFTKRKVSGNDHEYGQLMEGNIKDGELISC